MPSGTATATYSCTGNDAVDGGLSSATLTAVGLNPFSLSAKVVSDPVDSPDDGEQFTMNFTWTITLPQNLVDVAVNTAMVTQLTQQGVSADR